MAFTEPHLTRHAAFRSAERHIPLHAVKMIVKYGSQSPTRNRCTVFMLSRDGIRQVRQECGRTVSHELGRYENVRVIVGRQDQVVTVLKTTKGRTKTKQHKGGAA